jgi:hypothetical protein
LEPVLSHRAVARVCNVQISVRLNLRNNDRFWDRRLKVYPNPIKPCSFVTVMPVAQLAIACTLGQHMSGLYDSRDTFLEDHPRYRFFVMLISAAAGISWVEIGSKCVGGISWLDTALFGIDCYSFAWVAHNCTRLPLRLISMAMHSKFGNALARFFQKGDSIG